MDKKRLTEIIFEKYNTKPDFPFGTYPDYAVFRHQSNNKWFALLMNVEKSKLGLDEPGALDVVNFKCDPLMLSSLLGEKGFFRAYHMNKASWVTVSLDGSASNDEILMLLDMSFDLTDVKVKNVKKKD